MKLMLNFLVVIFISLQSLTGQDEKALHFGININPKITFLNFENRNVGSNKNRLSYSLGVDLFYDISSRIQISTGLNYSRLNLNQKDYTLTWACDIIFMNNMIERNPNRSYIRDKLNIDYLGIPIDIKFKLIEKKNHLFARIGIESLLKIAENQKSYISECGAEEWIPESPITESNKINMKARIGIGYEFELLKKRKAYFGPNLELGMKNMFKDVGNISDLNNSSKTIELGLLIGVIL